MKAAPLEQYVQGEIARYSKLIRRRIQLALRRSDPEDIHQIRVIGRGIRVALRILSKTPRARRREINRHRNVMRRLARGTDRLRDLDVALWFLRSTESPIRSKDRKPASRALEKALAAGIRAERARLCRRIVPALSLRGIRPAGPAGSVHPRRDSIFARRIVEECLQQARGRLKRIRGEDDIQRLHRFRISVKKLRYSAELLRPFLHKRWNHRLKRLKSVQSILGRLHDDHVTAGILREVSRGKEGDHAEAVDRACRALRADSARQFGRFQRFRG